jgi:oligopeptide transport system substrate-binding protein
VTRPAGWAARAAALAATFLVACTADGGRVAGPRATADGSALPSPTLPTIAATPDQTVFRPGADVLRVAIPEPATLDPMLVQDPGSVLIARQLYEGLTRWDPESQSVVPGAAESWEVQRGGRRFVFRLRPGMTFHDGSPVTAADFQFAFNRIARRASGSDLAYTLERVRGFIEVNQLGSAQSLEGLEARGPLTLVVTLDRPFVELPHVLTHPGLVPVPREAVDDLDTFVTSPVGNGPFEIAEPWAPGGEILLRSFDGYWSAPTLDGIRFIPFADAAQSWLLFRQGELDVSEVPVGQIEEAAAEYGERGYRPLLNASYYGFNLTRSPLRDIRVRRAVGFAVDRARIANDIYKGTMVPPRGIVPAGTPGFEDDLCGTFCNYDPDRAAAIVDRLPARKRRLALDFTRGRPHGRVARFVAEDLRAAGFEVRVRGFGFDHYLRRLRDGHQGVYRLGWIAEYPTPDVFLNSLFASESPDNHSGFSDDKVDRLLRRAHRTGDRDDRLEAYRRAERSLLRRAAIVPIGSFEIHWAIQPYVANLEFDVTGGFDALGVTLGDR